MAEKLDPSEWVHHLPHIIVGGRKRIPHDCGEGRPLVVFRGDPESSAWCHRCGKLGRHEREMSLAERLELQRRQGEAEHAARATLALPECTSRDPSEWPQELKVWFYRLGLGPAHLAALGAYYNAGMDRVVVPVRDAGGAPVYWSARHARRSPKWLGPQESKPGLVAVYGAGRGESVVLTEDLLSAYKVGLECEAWCLLGTKMHDSVAVRLLADPRPVVTWLDDDRGRARGYNPGQESASAIRRRLNSFGKEVHNAKSEKDPKALGRERIKEVLMRCQESSG